MIIMLCVFGVAAAQTPREDYEAWKNQQKKNYSDYRQQRQNDYNAWRKKANEEYAEWLKGEWSKIKGHEAKPVPEEASSGSRTDAKTANSDTLRRGCAGDSRKTACSIGACT